MNAHIGDDLPRILTGEADRDTVMAAAEHLRSCPDCQQELVSAVVAHASLMSAHRFAPDVVRPRSAEPRPAEPPAHPLPDLSDVFAQVRAEAGQRRSRRPSGRVLAAVAAAVVVIGGGTAAGVIATSSNGPATHDVALVANARTVATATLLGSDHMRIDATALPKLGTNRQYEVWLTPASGQGQPLPVGWIGSDRRADIRVPAAVMGAYQDIAVSVQGIHQTAFSGDVVARGSYA